MKLFKKILCCIFVFTLVFSTFTVEANAAEKMRFYKNETGTVIVQSGTHKIYDEYGQYVGLDYVQGESFTYDAVYCRSDDLGERLNIYVQYTSYSGKKRFVQTSSTRTSTSGITTKYYVAGLKII